ncbi:hypothetical protein [Parvibaculum sp.]|uniref:hypothetical protein n=1 Tax=Parvibaculum sp. TaxID=2024848 RepID=UPI0027377AB0|nr:hypothetical protein [Parvibaculum sp.]MDP3329395.1 hypothetical protein [Parvibaculum sp.]
MDTERDVVDALVFGFAAAKGGGATLRFDPLRSCGADVVGDVAKRDDCNRHVVV